MSDLQDFKRILREQRKRQAVIFAKKPNDWPPINFTLERYLDGYRTIETDQDEIVLTFNKRGQFVGMYSIK